MLFNFFSVPAKSARRRALSRAMSASNPSFTSDVFSSTPESRAAFFNKSSSMFKVVRICINMHHLCICWQDGFFGGTNGTNATTTRSNGLNMSGYLSSRLLARSIDRSPTTNASVALKSAARRRGQPDHGPAVLRRRQCCKRRRTSLQARTRHEPQCMDRGRWRGARYRNGQSARRSHRSYTAVVLPAVYTVGSAANDRSCADIARCGGLGRGHATRTARRERRRAP